MFLRTRKIGVLDLFFEIIKALIFGIVEGISEWLPISSTGHMMILNQFLPLDVSPAFYDTFLVVIQLGAIMAVIILYFRKLNPFSFKKTPMQRRETWGIWGKVVIGSIPAAIVGLLLDEWVEEHIMNDPNVAYIVVACALIAYGIIFILLEIRNNRRIALAELRLGATGAVARSSHAPSTIRGKHARIDAQTLANLEEDDISDAEFDTSSLVSKVNTFAELSPAKAFCIGIFQSLAVIPGTSRSGSIIIGSMLLGTSRTIAAEFAFFLAIPIMFGWSLLKFIRHGFEYTANEWVIFAVGIVTAFVVSIISIKFLMGYIKTNGFAAFGVYRIILGAFVLLFFGTLALNLW